MSEKDRFEGTPCLIALAKDNVGCIGFLDNGQDCLHCMDNNFKTKTEELKADKRNIINNKGLLNPKACKQFKDQCGNGICKPLQRAKQAWMRGYNVFLQLDVAPNID